LKQALINMLSMQDRMNSRVHEQWIQQDFEWYRATWIECGELIEHYGYKWWKKQEADLEQVRLEVVDIWHFGLSALFRETKDIEQIANEIVAELEEYQPMGWVYRKPQRRWLCTPFRQRGFHLPIFGI
jgi:dimeric dUTPase (all-alpha-NTP-PPase superfamily)